MEHKKKQSCHCIHLRRAANHVSARYDAHLAPLGITINQFSILENIEKMEGCSVSELARKIKLERTTLVRTLKPLIERKLVLDTSEKNTRKRQLLLSESGKQLIASGKTLWDKAQQEIEVLFSEEEMEIFLSMMKKLENY